METRLLSIELGFEQDVVLARQRARQLTDGLGFEVQDQVRTAAAVSEAARFARTNGAGAVMEFFLDSDQPNLLLFRVTLPRRPADRPVEQAEELIAARRIMDSFAVTGTPTTASIVLGKKLPRKVGPWSSSFLQRLADRLKGIVPENIYQEFQAQNQELLHTLAELRKHQAELAQLNRELEETNRGVVALYAELEEKAETLRQNAEQKTRFFSGISHEFRTPINSILRLSQILIERLDGDLTTEQEHQVTLINRSAQNLLEWVNDLLDLAKVDAGRMEVRVTKFTPADLLTGLRGVMRPLVTNPHIKLIFEDCGHLPPMETDEGKTAQILRNFISNSVKFTEQGIIRVSAMRCGGAVDQIEFAVVDTGVGIAPQDIERVFEEFVQVESVLQARSKGTGLGLPLSKRLATLLGGSITVTSAVGMGSRFAVRIPCVFQRPDAADRDSVPPETTTQFALQSSPVADRVARVLIVDDDESARYLLQRALATFQVDVIQASRGHEGLRLMRSLEPDLVFLDLSMPDVSGFQVLESIKEAEPTHKIPVVIYSSRLLDEAERHALERRALAILPKTHGAQPSADRLREILRQAGLAPAEGRSVP